MSMERRQFFRTLAAGGASVAQRPQLRNVRKHHRDEMVYHGPMLIPEDVARIIAEHPAIKKTTHRHLTSRYAQDGCTWLFRCQIPASRQMVGDIRRTQDGHMRVTCWSAARAGETYPDAAKLVAPPAPAEESMMEYSDYAEPMPRPAAPILPPMMAAWRAE